MRPPELAAHWFAVLGDHVSYRPRQRQRCRRWQRNATLLLHTGYYGDVASEHAYNASPIIIAAAAGAQPRLRSLLIRSAQNWIVQGLDVSPSFSAPN